MPTINSVKNPLLIARNAMAFLSLFSIHFYVIAHEPSHINQENHIKIKAAMSVKSASIVDDESAWLIPGISLGNEATVPEKGAAIDDIQVTGRLNLEHSYYLGSKIGFHQHNSSEDAELQLENFWLGKYLTFESGILRLDAGQMSSRVTPTANHHPSQDNFSSTPLLADVFFGGHHKDVGMSANWFMSPITFNGATPDTSDDIGFAKIEFGIELWNGNSWPYGSGDGNVSLFSKYHGELYSLKTDFGVWFSTGQASARADERYNGDHHSSTNITVPDAVFSGDVNTFGGYLELSHPIYKIGSSRLSWQGNWEWMQMQQEGVFSGTTQSAYMSQTLDGYSALIGLTLDQGEHQHKLFTQYEMLVVNNDFTDTTDAFLTEQQLVNNGFEPNRLKLGYHWQWNKNFTLRIETLLDKTQLSAEQTTENTTAQTEQVWTLGLIWQHNLL